MTRFRASARWNKLCVACLVLISLYAVVTIQLTRRIVYLDDETRSNHPKQLPTRTSARASSPVPRILELPSPPTYHSEQEDRFPRRLLVIAAAPRSLKHLVALWSSLECFTSDTHHVIVSAPLWSHAMLERFLKKALASIPRFSSGEISLEGMVTINDRYDVGLWCDALDAKLPAGSGEPKSLPKDNSDSDEVALLNDSVYALREYTGIFEALSKHSSTSMSSLSYSYIHPKGTGDEFYWLESVWRGFDKKGIQAFREHSCVPADHPFFCPRAWWGRKGCIVENFERAMARQFPRNETVGLFASDVPHHLLTYRDSFPSWVRHAPYWKQLVETQGFPVSKTNWRGMVEDPLHDERLTPCTQHLDRSWLEGFDFSVAESAI